MNKFFSKILQDKGVILAAAWSFNQLAYAIVYPFVPLYLSKERGITYTIVSLIFPLIGVAGIIAPLPCGWMTDRLGRRFMMLFGQLGRAALFFLLALLVYINAPFWCFALTLMLNSAVGVAFQVGADSFLTDITTPDVRPGYYSKIRVGFNVGWALGPMLGAFFAQTPFWLFFIATGFLCIAGAVYTQCACFNGLNVQHVNIPKEEKKKEDFNIVTDVLKNFRFMMILCGSLLLMLLASQLYSTFSAFSTQRIGISKEALGSIYSLNGFMVLALQIPIVSLIKKIKIPVLAQLVAGTLLYAASYFFLGFAAGTVMLAIAVAAITLAEIIVHPALYTTVSSETQKGNTGKMLSMYTLTRGIGYSVGPWIGAQIFDATNSAVILWGTLSVFAAISAIVFLFSGKSQNNNI